MGKNAAHYGGDVKETLRSLSLKRIHLAAVMPLTGIMIACLLAGCHKDDTASASPPATGPGNPAPPPAPLPPGGPTSTGGPGGTMMNTPSANPSGAAGDAVITAKVKSALIADNKVKATAINVDTKSNAVVLRGTQPAQADITEAVIVAKKTQGVKSVINQLTVKS